MFGIRKLEFLDYSPVLIVAIKYARVSDGQTDTVR